MSALHGAKQLRRRLLLAATGLLTLALPACTCEDTNNRFDWNHPWSWPRLGTWGGLVVVAAAFAFFILFPALLQPEKRKAPWPLTAFGWCLAIWWLLSGALFLLLFAGLFNDLRRNVSGILPPGALGSFVNQHWQWLLVLALTLVGTWLIYWRVRHHERVAD